MNRFEESLLERNHSNCVLLSFVQGRRSLRPTDEDLSVGPRPWWSRRLECCGFGIHQLWFRYGRQTIQKVVFRVKNRRKWPIRVKKGAKSEIYVYRSVNIGK
jgi:hypothetical protein